MADSGEKTEQATPRRLQKAREEGNYLQARIFVNALQFLTFVALLHSWGPSWIRTIRESMATLLEHGLDARLQANELMILGATLLARTMMPLLWLGGALLVITLAVQLGITRFGVTLKKLAPDIKRLNPISRLTQLPSQNIPAVLQAIAMIPVFGAAVYFIVRDRFETYLTLPLRSIPTAISEVAESLETLLWKAGFVFVVFGAIDLFRQKQRYSRQLKMSKQEIRDEMKEVDGNPMMKARIRRIRRDMARKRMMHEVPKATAVIVNPTHFAVAIKYEMQSMGAPKVVAKGKNYLALRIRQKAVENQVPLIENPPLAQALYKSVEVGQEIPSNFYRAIAEILAYIFKLMNGR
jgi:flagellar biosynthetic protein FlhB